MNCVTREVGKCSPSTKSTLQLQNKFHYIKNTSDITKLIYGFDMYINTKSLTLDTLPHEQQYRLDLMKKLQDEGLTNKEIAEYLNKQNILTPTGKTYNVGLVWCTLDKYKKRLKRMTFKIKIINPGFYENIKL